MPQIKYSEAVNILDIIWNQWEPEDKKRLLITSVRYFFSRSLIKPCPLLVKNECRIYADRPLSCRLYGLWPNDVWERRVARFEKSLDLPREKLPLNVQCPYVRRNGAPLTEDRINALYKMLDDLDLRVGNLKDEHIKKSWNYRTLHDWILFRFFGEEMLIKMGQALLCNNPQQIEEIIAAFEKSIAEEKA